MGLSNKRVRGCKTNLELRAGNWEQSRDEDIENCGQEIINVDEGANSECELAVRTINEEVAARKLNGKQRSGL